MYIDKITRAKKAIIKKFTETMSLNDIKQVKKDHIKKRQMVRQQKNKHKNKNKLNINDII